MVTPLSKARDLITLAVNPGAGSEEARSAAYAAVQLIYKHGLLRKNNPKPEPPPQLTRYELRRLAEEKVERFVAFLQKKAEHGEFPVLSATFMVSKAENNREIHPLDAHDFLYYLRRSLVAYKEKGVLVAKVGFEGGYYLPHKEPHSF